MAKVHLVQTKNPLNEGESATSMCNCVIFKVQIGASCDGGDDFDLNPDSMLKSLQVCKKCLEQEWMDRYLYMVKEAAIEDFGDMRD